MRNDFMSRPNDRGDVPLLQIPSAFRLPEDSRYVIKQSQEMICQEINFLAQSENPLKRVDKSIFESVSTDFSY